MRYLMMPFCLFSVLFLMSCSPEVKAKRLDVQSQSCFKPVSDAPLFIAGDFFKGSNWNDPSVLNAPASSSYKYMMYASSIKGWGSAVEIYRLLSNDAQHWDLSPKHPVLRPTPSKIAWDKKGVETPSVVFFKGQYHLFYTGYDKGFTDVMRYKIGHAVSNDGVKWIKKGYVAEPSNPNKPVDLSFNQFVVAEPGAVVFQGKIYLYFSAVGANTDVGTTLQTIGLITSDDGVQWSKPEMVLKPKQNLYPRSQYQGYSTPAALVVDNKMHLFVDVAKDKPFKQVAFHHAQSNDGVTNWVQDTYPLHTKSDFPWAKDEIISPAAFMKDNKLHLFYAGRTGGKIGIGLSICQ